MGQFTFKTAGESHGKGLIAIIEGIVADLEISEDYIAIDLQRRQRGHGRGERMKIEADKAEIISGVRYGMTTGSPIGLVIWNRDWANWKDVMSTAPSEKRSKPIHSPRPAHADLAGMIKYASGDIRPILERASARETAARVAVGAIARKFLQEFGIAIHSHTISIGNIRGKENINPDWQQMEKSPVRCADKDAEKKMIKEIDKAKADGDSLGGVFEIICSGVPVGLGSYVHWDKRLDMQVAGAVMSINAVKGVEIGSGFNLSYIRGSEAHDIIEPAKSGESKKWHRPTNRAGGIEGGISNGEPIVVRGAMKPIATLGKSLPSIDLYTGEVTGAHYERSDICVVPAGGVIGEAMLAIVLTNAVMEKFGGDNIKETLANYHSYINSILS